MTENLKNRPTYYAVLTADVRYDPTLSNLEKILYAEISALCNKEGFCWATNDYFAELYNRHERHISSVINKLAKKEYIEIELNSGGEGGGSDRRIYLSLKSKIEMPPKKQKFRSEKPDLDKRIAPSDAEKPDLDTLSNNITKKEYSAFQESAQNEHFMNLWKRYPVKLSKKEAYRHYKSSVKTEQDRQDIEKALDNYLAHLANPENKWKKAQNGKTWFNNWQDWIDFKEPERPEDREAITQVEKEIQTELFKLQEKIAQIETSERPIDRLEEKTRTQKRILVREKELGLIQSGKWTIETWLSYQMLLNERRLRQAQKIGTPDLDVEIKKLFAMEAGR